MLHHKLGMNVLMIALTVGAAVCYGAFLLYGIWIDGKQQAVREHGGHPVTTSTGEVKAEHREGDRQDG